MQVEEEPIETIHLYIVKQEEKRPPVLLPLMGAFLCVALIVGVTIYSALYPSYVHQTLRIPAQFLPLQAFSTTEPIIPTGIKNYPATTAHGTLTLTNGSVVTEQLPQGMIFSGQGIEVMTDEAVFVPAGNAVSYGIAMISAHALTSGSQGNIRPLAINAVYGTSLYIRNLHAFTGGKDVYTVQVATPQDKQTALDAARAFLTLQAARTQAILTKPCNESSSWSQTVHLTWICQFIAYPSLPGMKITAIRLKGSTLFVDVVFVARSKTILRK